MLQGVEITAHVRDGFSFKSPDGVPLHLALVDGSGNQFAVGACVSKAVLTAAVRAYEDFWVGNGGLVVLKGE